MKNNFIKLLVNVLLIYIFFFLFKYSGLIKENIQFAINIWINTLIPSIFPFILLSSFLINYGFIDLLCLLFGNITEKIFHLPKEATFAIITSIFTGFPTGSKYVKDLLKEKKINIQEANHLIMFTNYSNPLFVVFGIGETLLHNKNVGYLIFFSHLFTGLFIGFLTRNKINNINKKLENEKRRKKFINVLLDAIDNSFKILINMLGIIIFFLIIITIINKIFKESLLTLIIDGIIEMTSGINLIVAKKNISNRLKASIVGFFISFSGLSVHFQIKSIIDDTEINYKNFLFARIFHAILCFILIYTLYFLVS